MEAEGDRKCTVTVVGGRCGGSTCSSATAVATATKDASASPACLRGTGPNVKINVRSPEGIGFHPSSNPAAPPYGPGFKSRSGREVKAAENRPTKNGDIYRGFVL